MSERPDTAEPGPASKQSAQPDTPLTARVVQGTGWVMAGRVVAGLLLMGRVLVLARLLTPEDFGLFGICMLAIGALQTFTQTGFDTALIQRRDDASHCLDTAWVVQVLRGLVLAALLVLLAPVIAGFFEEPLAVPLLRAMGLSVLLNGLVNIGIVYFRKDIQLHRFFIYSVGSAAAGLVVGVATAYWLRSAWALVWGSVATASARIVLSYALHPYRPRLSFDRALALELFRFGRWIMLSTVGSFMLIQGPDAVVGKVLAAAALGVYQMAYRLANLVATEICHTIAAVMLPAYCKISHDNDRLRAAYLRVMGVLLLLMLPLGAATVIFIRPFVLSVLTDKWVGIIVPTQILAIWGFRRGYSATQNQVLTSLGKPRVPALLLWARLAILAPIIVPLTLRRGVLGTAISVVICGLPVDVVCTVVLHRLLKCRWRDFLAAWAAPVLLTATATCAALILRALLPVFWQGVGNLVLEATVFSIAYGAGAAIFCPQVRQVASLIVSEVLVPLKHRVRLTRMGDA
jgi:O-antigen/teichoic acid export membrane protein